MSQLEVDDENEDVASMPLEIGMDIDEPGDKLRYVREDCEGILM